MALLYTLYGITALFFLILLARVFMPDKKSKKICSICAATTITWVFLLILFYLKKFNDIIIVAMLIGMTLLGIFYTFEKKARKELTFFRLPLFLTLVVFGYFILTFDKIINEIILIIIVWLVFVLIYYYKETPKFNSFVNKVIECCKKW